MKAILRASLGLAGLLLLTTVSQGYYWVTPVTYCPYGQAPSPSNSGFYLYNVCGCLTGPHYYLVPPFPPFNGMLPCPSVRQTPAGLQAFGPPLGQGGNAFPMHPFTRSPRDFFMWGEMMEEEQRLRNRPFPLPR